VVPVYIATEDFLSAAVVEKLVNQTEGRLQVVVRISGRGFGGLKKKLTELTRVASAIPVILLTDLDRKECAPTLISEWFGNRAVPPKLLFRVAVREVESWLMADKERFAEFARVPLNRLSDTPDEVDDPKQELLNLIWRHSPSEIKHDIAARHAGGTRQGLSYNERLIEFAHGSWRPAEAASRSQSLARAIQRIRELAEERAT
jgi:hypothetical protein